RRQQKPQRLRVGDDGAVVEQIEQKRAHGFGFIRAAKIEENDGDATRRDDAQAGLFLRLGLSGFGFERNSAHAAPFTMRTNSATFSGAALGVTPWPRLKMCGPPRKSSIT